MTVVGRFAPSPTGYLHMGSARTALLAWLAARSIGGRFLMRIEDLDPPRVVPGAADVILEDLRWLGLDWDEGPDIGGQHAPYVQSQRSEHYLAAIEKLKSAQRAYPCTCSRKEIAQSNLDDSRGASARSSSIASAPHGPEDEGPRYPGTCRQGVSHPERAAAWRFALNEIPTFEDAVFGMVKSVDYSGDFVLSRADGVFGYHLAVVVDDALMGVNQVVRGADLLTSTARQIALQHALGLPTPVYAHVPLMMAPDGQRLAKRHKSSAIAALRAEGMSAAALRGKLAHSAGLQPDESPVDLPTLCSVFQWSAIAKSSSISP